MMTFRLKGRRSDTVGSLTVNGQKTPARFGALIDFHYIGWHPLFLANRMVSNDACLGKLIPLAFRGVNFLVLKLKMKNSDGK